MEMVVKEEYYRDFESDDRAVIRRIDSFQNA
jgi:hypothetical protein